MTKVVADITMSLDGFVTGPDPDLEHGLGRGREPLHAWDHATTPPFFVVTHSAPEDVRLDLDFTFVLAPIVLGSGTPLLVDCHRRQLVQREVRSSPSATHLTYALRT